MAVERPRPLKTEQARQAKAAELGGATRYFAAMARQRAGGRADALDFVAPKTTMELKDWLAKVPTKHVAERKSLVADVEAQFERMWLELRTGFSVLLYGFGSKIDLLNRFAKLAPKLAAPRELMVCTIKGYDESVDVGVLVDDVITQWLAMSPDKLGARRGRTWKLLDKCEVIRAESERRKDLNDLLLVVHSLDMIRKSAAIAVLSALSSCRKIHLVASMDHVSSMLLCPKPDLDRFNFCWHEAHTFAFYAEETHQFASTAVQSGRGLRSGRGAAYVLKSLTPHHLSILKEMGRRQLEPDGREGIDARALADYCTSSMLLSANNQKMLDTYLAEFIDHELVVRKKAGDGSERLVINMDNAAIEREIMHFGEEGI